MTRSGMALGMISRGTSYLLLAFVLIVFLSLVFGLAFRLAAGAFLCAAWFAGGPDVFAVFAGD